MTPLPLELFVNVERLSNSSIFANLNIFDLLGMNLSKWVQELCAKAGAHHEPVIQGQVHPSAILEGAVFVGENAKIGPFAYIEGPCFIAPGAEVRHAAYIRGPAYIGSKAVVGHTSEVKGSVFFDHAKAGHFAYVGDSILGYNVNLGAGTKLANLKLKGDEVRFKHPTSGLLSNSGLRKFGSVLGDQAQTGCNAVLSPGSLILPERNILPCAHFRGTLT